MIGAEERHPRQQQRDAGDDRDQQADQPQADERHPRDDPDGSPHAFAVRLGRRTLPGSDGPPLLSLGTAEAEDSLRESLQARGRDRLTACLAEAIGPLPDLLLGPGQYPESLDQGFASGQHLLFGHGFLNGIQGI